jgi:hypothetical protein
MIQQLALIAQQRGRAVYLVQWDVTRRVFETHPAGIRYPEVDAVTHPAIRWACGLWVRDAVLRWHLDHPESAPLLIGEALLVSNRFVELAQRREDRAEDLLQAAVTEFFVPVPSVTVRQAIQQCREQEMRQPRHEQERASATVGVLHELWQEIQRASHALALPGARPGRDYQPPTYAELYGPARGGPEGSAAWRCDPDYRTVTRLATPPTSPARPPACARTPEVSCYPGHCARAKATRTAVSANASIVLSPRSRGRGCRGHRSACGSRRPPSPGADARVFLRPRIWR